MPGWREDYQIRPRNLEHPSTWLSTDGRNIVEACIRLRSQRDFMNSPWTGHIILDVKCAGARSAGNPHAMCDEAGAGNRITVRIVRHSQRKRGAMDRPNLRSNSASPRPYQVSSRHPRPKKASSAAAAASHQMSRRLGAFGLARRRLKLQPRAGLAGKLADPVLTPE